METMFYERLILLCNERGTTPTAMAKAMGISTSMTANWKKGGVPRSDTLQKVANHFGVSVSYLLGEMDASNSITLVDSCKKEPSIKKRLKELMEDMNEEELEELERYSEFILSRKKGY